MVSCDDALKIHDESEKASVERQDAVAFKKRNEERKHS
jgi:hypothetical protein